MNAVDAIEVISVIVDVVEASTRDPCCFQRMCGNHCITHVLSRRSLFVMNLFETPWNQLRTGWSLSSVLKGHTPIEPYLVQIRIDWYQEIRGLKWKCSYQIVSTHWYYRTLRRGHITKSSVTLTLQMKESWILGWLSWSFRFHSQFFQ